jgi:hypothetical protein
VIAVLVALALSVLSLDAPDLVKAAGYSMLSLAVVVLVALLIGAYTRPWLVRLCRAVLTRLLSPGLAARLVQWTDDFLAGLAVLRSVRRLVKIIATTAILWAVYLLFYHLMLMAFWPSPPLAWSALTVAAASLSVAIPSSPGYVGVFDAAIVLVMAPYLGSDRAVAYAIVLHTVEIVATVIFGVYGLAALGLSLGRVRAGASSALPEAAPDPVK